MEQKKVLCIEDDAFLLSLISGKLVETGFTVLTAASGTAGISKATLEHPDAVLLDVMLPDMGGFDILEKLKSDPVTQSIPVIILSNLGGQSEIEKAIKLGAASYIIKSNIVPDEIAQMVTIEMARVKNALPVPPPETTPPA
jgi:two-component system sensor histidine kinase/response regulator